ncbi:MAG: hypothetical protein K6E85_04020 [Lachnospiraceae bacterium]|nr:hypothetical protein [Lachnospiraceae bacterium]
MITVKSMDVRDNFKNWCMKAADGEYLEMEVLEKHINVFQIDKEGNEEQKEIPIDETVVNDIVEAFYDRAV